MTQRDVRRVRRVAVAAVVAMALAVGAPAQAATRPVAKAGPSWFQAAVHWVASLLPADWTKGRQGIDPDGLTTAPLPPLGGDRGSGIDPDG
jgi:hypothetical protein